jgi:lactoylglutathione lyase
MWFHAHVRSIDYVILYVDDLEGSVTFYRDVVGLDHRFTDHGYAEFDTGPTRFGLYAHARLPELIGRTASGAVHPQGEVLFLVDDVDAEAVRLRDAGVEVLTGPVDRPWGHRTLHLLDPEGHVVELAQEIPRERRRSV